MQVEKLIAQYITNGAQFAFIAVAITQQARIRVAAAIGEGGEIQGNDLKIVHVFADFFGFFIAVQPYAQTAIAGFKCMSMLAPQGQRHDQIIAIGDGVEARVLGQQVPGFIDHFVVLNDSLHRRAP